MQISTRLLGGTAFAAVVMALAAAPALGQAAAPGPVAAADDDSGTIVVTGSRIRRDPLNQDSPVITLDQASLEQTGLSSVADILQRLPSASGGLNSKFNNSGNFGNPPDGGGVGAGAAEIDLRYLRASGCWCWSTACAGSRAPRLRRSGAVDLNTIPPSMIERIEVLQEGASPLYGSDAIAGVVNIITDAARTGLRASAQFGKFSEGDGYTQDYNVS